VQRDRCAPRADVQRIVLYDGWISSVAVGRSVATIAELCFATQWALLLEQLARRTGVQPAIGPARVMVPLIVVAETCSWYAVLTTNYLGNACEETLWTLSAALFVIGFALLFRHATGVLRALVALSILVGCAYVTFMCTVDVPMYLGRWHADTRAGREYLTLSAGLRGHAPERRSADGLDAPHQPPRDPRRPRDLHALAHRPARRLRRALHPAHLR
jgi:hypothetical protein